MVDWYLAAKLDNAKSKARTKAIHDSIEKLYDGLWDEIKRQVSDLQREHGEDVGLYTNGSQFDRVVGIQNPSDAHNRKTPKNELHLTLNDEMIIASFSADSLDFKAAPGSDDVVRLTYKGADKTMQDAAVMILRRFLFPDIA